MHYYGNYYSNIASCNFLLRFDEKHIALAVKFSNSACNTYSHCGIEIVWTLA